MEPLAREHHAGFHQLFVVLAHLGQDLLVREDARLRVLVGLDDNHESHRDLSFWILVERGVAGSTGATILLRRRLDAGAPAVQFRYQRELEPPHPSEGFSRIETIPFERARDASFTNRALIVWCDGVLRDPVARPFHPSTSSGCP